MPIPKEEISAEAKEEGHLSDSTSRGGHKVSGASHGDFSGDNSLLLHDIRCPVAQGEIEGEGGEGRCKREGGREGGRSERARKTNERECWYADVCVCVCVLGRMRKMQVRVRGCAGVWACV